MHSSLKHLVKYTREGLTFLSNQRKRQQREAAAAAHAS